MKSKIFQFNFLIEMNKYPWMALIWIYSSSHDKWYKWCGGTLVASKYVISAAHCLENPGLTPSDIKAG